MASSLSLFSFRGIRVRVHWSFLLIIAWVGWSGVSAGYGPAQIAQGIALVLLLFVCVVLHEFGHALTAQHFGVGTRHITLYPIGGVASLERMPEEPRQEFLITLAGPSVNLLIVLVVGTLHVAIAGYRMVMDPLGAPPSLLAVSSFLIQANLVLFLFNLLPAFPMDGGRLLRSLLAMRLSRERATRIAALLGRFFGFAFIAFGLFDGQPFMALIGVFVIMAASGEERMVRTQSVLQGKPVALAMRTLFWRMDRHATVAEAAAALLAGGDKDLIVTDGDAFLGILHADDILQSMEQGKQHTPLSELSPRTVPAVAPTDDVGQAYQVLLAGGHPVLPVISDSRILGIVEGENLAEFIRLQRSARSS